MMKKSIIPKEYLHSYEICKLLSEIQDNIGESIPSLFDFVLNHDELNTIRTVHAIVTKGKVFFKDATMEFDPLDPPSQNLQKLLNENGVQFKIMSEPVVVSILGKNIELGYKISYFRGVLDIETRKNLREGLARGSVEGLRVKIESVSGKLPAVEFYPRWLINADKILREFEAKHFEEKS
jgi:hypothetical protein